MIGRVFGFVIAILIHAAILLLGGWLFFHEPQAAKKEKIEIEVGVEAPDKPKDKKEETPPEKKEDETEKEVPPDAAEVMRNLEQQPANNDAPALEALSLSAIEQALSGQAAGGDFSEGFSFASGGRIGGTGKAGGLEQKLESAFGLAEIDQKPRATFQAQPSYPSEMRGKRVEGIVSVIFIVDATGKVTSPKVEKSSNPAFDKAALDAVRQWKFEPGLRGGQRVDCRVRVPIRFAPS